MACAIIRIVLTWCFNFFIKSYVRAHQLRSRRSTSRSCSLSFEELKEVAIEKPSQAEGKVWSPEIRKPKNKTFKKCTILATATVHVHHEPEYLNTSSITTDTRLTSLDNDCSNNNTKELESEPGDCSPSSQHQISSQLQSQYLNIQEHLDNHFLENLSPLRTAICCKPCRLVLPTPGRAAAHASIDIVAHLDPSCLVLIGPNVHEIHQ
jgi:hypothetical protein